MQLLIEAFIVGVVLVILWAVLRPLIPTGDIAALFIIGAATHLGFEAVGANRWYCTKGNACLNKESIK